MSSVQLLQVSKYYGALRILDQINLSIASGEFVVFVGPSGCGKSTLLRLIAGLEAPSSGDILLNQQCITEQTAAARNMAMVFQSYALYPHMTVYDNMAYGLKMRRIKSDVIKASVLKVAAMLKLTDFLNRKPRDLSGGQRQRVAMGRAIVRSPEVFLFDEPLSNLDAKLRTEMRYEIIKLHRSLRTTSIYVTHDQTEAMTMADRIVILNNGVIEQVGTPHRVYHQPESLFVAGFTGHYPHNALTGILDNESRQLKMDIGLSLPWNPAKFPHLKTGEKLILSVRPEHAKLTKHQQRDNVIPIKIEFVDDTGADKLFHTKTLCGQSTFVVRQASDSGYEYEDLAVEMMLSKSNLFHGETGKRIGGGELWQV